MFLRLLFLVLWPLMTAATNNTMHYSCDYGNQTTNYTWFGGNDAPHPVASLTSNFGSSLFFHDLNGDGNVDLFVGAPPPASTSGEVHVLFLNENAQVTSQALWLGTNLSVTGPAAFGTHVSYIGAMGIYDDVFVVSSVNYYGGAVWFVYVDTNGNILTYDVMTETAGGFTEAGVAADLCAGYGGAQCQGDPGGSAVSIGDLDEDGVPEVLTSTTSDDVAGHYDTGTLRLCFLQVVEEGSHYADVGEAQGFIVKSMRFLTAVSGWFSGAFFGASLTRMLGHDGNQDGKMNDVCVGAIIKGTNNAGYVYMVSFSESGSISFSTRIQDPSHLNADRFGSSVVDIGDLNDDGVGDIIVSTVTKMYLLFLDAGFTLPDGNYRVFDAVEDPRGFYLPPPLPGGGAAIYGSLAATKFPNAHEGSGLQGQTLFVGMKSGDFGSGSDTGGIVALPLGVCDCSTTHGYGMLCEIPCGNNATGWKTNRCNCSGTDSIGSTCDSKCTEGSFTTGLDPQPTQCNCSSINSVGLLCENPCNNGYTEGTVEVNFDHCNCSLSGASRKFCTKDIDDCSSCPCLNSGICTDFGNLYFPNHAHEYNCTCQYGYSGKNCEIPPASICESNPCQNNGTCEEVYDLSGFAVGFACNCSMAIGYEGPVCTNDTDDCLAVPCLNGGTCTDLLGGFSCECNGYYGETCNIDIDDCISNPCLNNGTCVDKGLNKYQCACADGWEGKKNCGNNIDDCLLTDVECLNGGACTDDNRTVNAIICDCTVANGLFYGPYCEFPLTNDACRVQNPCLNGGVCEVTDSELLCDCAYTGYTGQWCHIFDYLSPCSSGPCLNGGRCEVQASDDTQFTCVCDADTYHGNLCQTRYCYPEPFCSNNGTCFRDSCECAEGFEGLRCDDATVTADDESSSSSSSVSPPQDADEIVTDTEIVVQCDEPWTQEFLFYTLAGIIGLVFLNWFILREFPYFKRDIKATPTTTQRVAFMLLFALTLFDFITDVSFVDYVNNSCSAKVGSVDVFSTVAGTVVGLSAAFNLSVMLLILILRDSSNQFMKHLRKFPVVTVLAMIVACANISAVLVLDSNLLGFRSLTANFSPKHKRQLKLMSLSAGAVQNFPQLVTQATFVSKTGLVNSVTMTSISMTSLLMMITVMRTLVLIGEMITKQDKVKYLHDEEEQPVNVQADEQVVTVHTEPATAHEDWADAPPDIDEVATNLPGAINQPGSIGQ